jgi:hypothetical protein
MGSKGTLSLSRISERRHPFTQFSKKITLPTSRSFNFDCLLNHLPFTTPFICKPYFTQPTSARNRIASFRVQHR